MNNIIQNNKIFSFTNSDSIGIYIDFSNMFHAKYTLGWTYDIEKFLNYLKNDKNIKEVCFYGAYDKTNINQFNWVRNLKNTYKEPNFYFYFKGLERKGEKNKGNVDTEMGFDISENKNKWKTLILFSGDGDFLYIIKKLIEKFNKQVVVISTKGHIAKELIDFINKSDDKILRFVDIKKDNKISLGIKSILKNYKRGLCIPPELVEKIKNATNQELEEFKKWMELVLEQKARDIDLPTILNGLKNKNNFDTFKTILFWRKEEKKLLYEYLKGLTGE